MKLKLGFDIDGDYSWNNLLYRNLIQDMFKNASQIELFLITQNTDNKNMADIQAEIGLDNAHVFVVTDNAAVVTLLSNYNINIYLTTKNDLCRDINTNIPFTNTNDIITGCEAILVNSLPDIFKNQPKYITFLQFWIGQWNKTQPSEENC